MLRHALLGAPALGFSSRASTPMKRPRDPNTETASARVKSCWLTMAPYYARHQHTPPVTDGAALARKAAKR